MARKGNDPLEKVDCLRNVMLVSKGSQGMTQAIREEHITCGIGKPGEPPKGRRRIAEGKRREATCLGIVFLYSGDAGHLGQGLHASRIVTEGMFVSAQCEIQVPHLFGHLSCNAVIRIIYPST